MDTHTLQTCETTKELAEWYDQKYTDMGGHFLLKKGKS